MDITILHPQFMTQLLELRISGYWSCPRILLNGVVVKRIAGEYSVLNDAGHEMAVKLNTRVFNTLPQLLIEGEEVKICTKFHPPAAALRPTPVAGAAYPRWGR